MPKSVLKVWDYNFNLLKWFKPLVLHVIKFYLLGYLMQKRISRFDKTMINARFWAVEELKNKNYIWYSIWWNEYSIYGGALSFISK